jgi:Sensors of blue-light using FAD
MLQIIYASVASKPYSTKMLVELLDKARNRNSAAGISGMLLYHEGSFLQVLEGPNEAVDALYEKIHKDPGHCDPILLSRELIEKKEFEEWSMGFVDTSHLAEKFQGFMEYSSSLKNMTVDKGRAHKILKRFQEGAWHRAASK